MAGDSIDLDITLDRETRLVLLTQGSTKIFKSPGRDVKSRQAMNITVGPGAGLCYLPDPVQPFKASSMGQHQIYEVGVERREGDSAIKHGSLCALDWVCEGRRARGENWRIWGYESRNEVWLTQPGASQEEAGKRRLLLRDNLMLEDELRRREDVSNGLVSSDSELVSDFASRMDSLGVFGTLILHGPLFRELGKFFMQEFNLLPRIGGRKWDTGDDKPVLDSQEAARKVRQQQETADGLLWTVSNLRSCTVVKFGAKEVEGGKRWLRHMLETEGSVPSHFGERALLCLK